MYILIIQGTTGNENKTTGCRQYGNSLASLVLHEHDTFPLFSYREITEKKNTGNTDEDKLDLEIIKQGKQIGGGNILWAGVWA